MAIGRFDTSCPPCHNRLEESNRTPIAMSIIIKKAAAGTSVVLFLGAILAFAQDSSRTTSQAAPPAASQKALPSAVAVDHSRAYYHYMLARRYKELAGITNRGDYLERAISEYKQAMEADPQSLFLRVELGELYWRVGRIGDAVKEAEDVLKTNPNQEDAHRLLAQIYLRNLGELQPEKGAKDSLHKAIEHFEAVIRLDPSDTDSYVVLGRLYKLSNQNEKAEEAFKKALQNEANSRGALENLAQLYSDEGESDEAIELLKKIPESEMDASMLGLLAYAYSQNHELNEAFATYEKSLALEPDNLEIRRSYAEALMNGGKLDAAQKELGKILKADPEDGPTYLRLAQIDRQRGKFDQARQSLERAQTLMPDNLEVPYQQVLLEEAVGNDDKAIQILQDLLKATKKPAEQYTMAEANNRSIFLERLGLIYRSQEKFEPALEVFKEVAGLGDSQGPRGEGLIIETLRLKGEPQKALEEANAAIQKFPQDRSLRLLRASLLGEQGRVDESKAQLQAMLNGTPADREIDLALAQIYSQAKLYTDAEAMVGKALAVSPKPEDQEYVHFLLGSIFEREKKYDRAEEQFKQVLAVDPLNAAAANYLGYMLADRGVRLEESVRYIQKALQVEPNNGAYLDSLGWAYYKMKRYDLAEPPLEKAARLMSSDPTIHEHLGHLYLQTGKKQLAEQEWERALKEWPHTPNSDFDADQAAKLQKQLDELKARTAKQ